MASSQGYKLGPQGFKAASLKGGEAAGPPAGSMAPRRPLFI
jgi:hypothetical protein